MTRTLDFAQAFTLALAHFDAGRLKAARQLCEDIARARPGYGGAHYLLGLIALKNTQARRAVEHLERAAALDPGAGAPRLALARAVAAAGRGARAVEEYQRALALTPDDAQAHVELADALRGQGRPEAAVHHYAAAAAAAPTLAAAWSGWGAVLTALGRTAEATQPLRRALALEPDNALTLNNLGVAVKAQGDRAEAATLFARAIDRTPHARAHANLASVLKDLGQFAVARHQAEAALKLDRGDAATWMVLGEALTGLGELSAAEAAFRQAARHDPGLAHALFRAAELAVERGDVAAAAGDFRRTLDLDPADRHGAALHLALLGATPAPARAPDAYVAALFDQYADSFDHDLVESLGYRGPEIVAAALARALGDAPRGLVVLDAGCGTGLAAPLLRPLAARLEGVDLAPRMVDKARERGLYDALAVGDLVGFMAARPAAFDLIAAADVFVYLGDLAPVLVAAAAALNPGGWLAFTVEKAESAWHVGAHQRYAHAPDYVRDCAVAAGFDVAVLDDAVTRCESGQPVAGLVVVLRR